MDHEKKNSITLDLDHSTKTTLDAVVAAVPLSNRHAVARAALRAGLTLLASDPTQIVALLQGKRVNIGSGDRGMR